MAQGEEQSKNAGTQGQNSGSVTTGTDPLEVQSGSPPPGRVDSAAVIRQHLERLHEMLTLPWAVLLTVCLGKCLDAAIQSFAEFQSGASPDADVLQAPYMHLLHHPEVADILTKVVLSILITIRFLYGDKKYVDALYKDLPREGKGIVFMPGEANAEIRKFYSSWRAFFDLAVLVLDATLIYVLASLQKSVWLFFWLFLLLMAVDCLKLFFANLRLGTKKDSKWLNSEVRENLISQNWLWIGINLPTLILGCVVAIWWRPADVYFYYMGIISANCIFDVVLSWHHYFPEIPDSSFNTQVSSHPT